MVCAFLVQNNGFQEDDMSEQISYEKRQGTLYLHLPPEIDHHSSREIRD